MGDITKDALLNARLRHRKPGRRFTSAEGVRWGELVTPAPGEGPRRTEGGLRVVVFATFPLGYRVLRSVQFLEQAWPGRLSLVGVVTDDAINTDARVGLKRRLWHFLPADEHLDIESSLVEAGLGFGVPVFTGDTKSAWFHDHLRAWAPDVILVCGFGQLIDPVVLGVPPLGICNLHPSDLASGLGRGPAPHEEVRARGASTTRWSVHLMDVEFDTGPVLGASPPYNLRLEDGSLFTTPVQYFDKMIDGLDFLAVSLAAHLVRAHASGRVTPVDSIDLEGLPAAVCHEMMSPIDPTAAPRRRPEPRATALTAWLNDPGSGGRLGVVDGQPGN